MIKRKYPKLFECDFHGDCLTIEKPERVKDENETTEKQKYHLKKK